MTERESMWPWLLRLWRHLWQSERAAWHAVPDNMAKGLTARVRASERRHAGQVMVCIEGALPLSYAWRAGRQTPLSAVMRQRAMAWFGRLRVWDTEHNNGVLIYLLLAERRIEIVADRGLMRHTSEAHWQAVLQALRHPLQQGDFESGLTQALEAVSALLVAHFPLTDSRPNELSDLIVRA
jgi:uncharacterized membrane protein